MRALMSPDHRSTSLQNEGITDGIQISSWSHSVPGTADAANKTITYSIWDFAGLVLITVQSRSSSILTFYEYTNEYSYALIQYIRALYMSIYSMSSIVI